MILVCLGFFKFGFFKSIKTIETSGQNSFNSCTVSKATIRMGKQWNGETNGKKNTLIWITILYINTIFNNIVVILHNILFFIPYSKSSFCWTQLQLTFQEQAYSLILYNSRYCVCRETGTEFAVTSCWKEKDRPFCTLWYKKIGPLKYSTLYLIKQ